MNSGYRLVAVVSDVHGNVPALRAVLADARAAGVDTVVSCGDLTWGAEPDLTAELVSRVGAILVRGNACRAALELARGEREPGRETEHWMLAHHGPQTIAILERSLFSTSLEVETLGTVRFCHGSPRKDTEVVTPGTPEERIRELSAGIDETILVTGHTHLQFDRNVGGIRSVNPGSVGLPYHRGSPGTAYWATLGIGGVHLRQSHYDVSEAIRAYHDNGHPLAGTLEQMLMDPPTPEEIIEHAESLVFSE
ncbi:MAG TPA: YfcE family phosphodiesterase [Candidatus Limnocylindrales bacterium]